MDAVKVIVLLICMIFCHIVDDFYLQGILASMKQKEWWGKQTDNKKYKYDYIISLAMHATSWAFMIMLPLLIYTEFNGGIYLVMFPVNIIIHAIVDNLKANKKKINLVQDQLIHMVQILVTLAIFVITCVFC